MGSDGDEGDPELNRDEALGLLRTIPQGVAVLDKTGTLCFLNDACAELHGWPSRSEEHTSELQSH